MARFVGVSSNLKGTTLGVTEKYVKQTYEAMSNASTNLEIVAKQISLLPVREQRKFLRLLLNYIEEVANLSQYRTIESITMADTIELCNRLIDVVNDHYFEQDEKHMAKEGI